MKQLKKCWRKSWELGREYAAKYASEREAVWAMPLSVSEYLFAERDGCAEFFHAGFVDREPEWVEAWRYGELPEGCYSVNWAENKYEPGVSVVKIIRNAEDETYPERTTYALLGRDKIRVAGWWLGLTGSDGEPTLLGCEVI